jgi:hypothetical protein
MKAYEGVDVYIHAFLTLALAGGDWPASRPGRFTPRERAPGTHWIGGWVGPRASLDNMNEVDSFYVYIEWFRNKGGGWKSRN